LVGFDPLVKTFHWSPRFWSQSQHCLSRATIPALCDWKRNGKASSGKHTHHFHIKFFYITNLIKQQEWNPNWILSNWGYDCGLHDKTFSWCQVWTLLQTHCEPPILDSNQFLDWPAGASVLDNKYQSLTQSRYSHNNHYDCKMTQKPINVLTNDNPKSKVIPQWKANKLQNSSH
jgi:hypothetical protein